MGILKQLFCKVDSDKIPQSRYRKIKKMYYWKCLLITTILMLLVILGIAFFAPDVMDVLLSMITTQGSPNLIREGSKTVGSDCVAIIIELLAKN